MIAAVTAVGALACHPTPGLGSVSYVRASTEHIIDLATCRERVISYRTTSALISPNGRFSARIVTTRSRSHGTQAIVVRDRETGANRVIYRTRESYRRIPAGTPGPIELFKWSGDNRWIFFAIDPMGSASLAADGLLIEVVSRQGGPTQALGFMLGYRDYLAWCNGRAVFTGGGDRRSTTNKRLLVAGPPSWKIRTLVKMPRRVWGSVVCARDGRSVIVQSQRADISYSFLHTNWALWRVGLDGSARQLTFPEKHYADESPRLANDGSVVFVRSHEGTGKLFAVRRRQIFGPILSLGRCVGYYGHVTWWSGYGACA